MEISKNQKIPTRPVKLIFLLNKIQKTGSLLDIFFESNDKDCFTYFPGKYKQMM